MRLGKREKIVVALGACCLVVLFLVAFIAVPFMDQKDALNRGIAVKRDGLQEMLRLRAEYIALKRENAGVQNNLKRRGNAFTLFSFLEQTAGRAHVKNHITYMRPSDARGTGRLKESMVEMKLDQITLKQLVDYLYLIESPENIVSVKRLAIKDSTNEPGYIDAILQVLTVVEG